MNQETEYSKYLSNLKGISTGLINKLKIKYRPYICPFEYIVKQAEKHDTIFDIGCGNGQLLFIIEKFSGGKKFKSLKGIEIFDFLVEQAKAIINQNSFNNRIIIEKYNGNNIPDDISQYEFITLIDVLHHIPKPYQNSFFEQLYHKMTPGSKFLLKDIDAASPFVYCNKLHDLALSGEIGNEISYKEALNTLQSLGFILIETFKKQSFWYPHYFILVEKPR